MAGMSIGQDAQVRNIEFSILDADFLDPEDVVEQLQERLIGVLNKRGSDVIQTTSSQDCVTGVDSKMKIVASDSKNTVTNIDGPPYDLCWSMKKVENYVLDPTNYKCEGQEETTNQSILEKSIFVKYGHQIQLLDHRYSNSSCILKLAECTDGVTLAFWIKLVAWRYAAPKSNNTSDILLRTVKAADSRGIFIGRSDDDRVKIFFKAMNRSYYALFDHRLITNHWQHLTVTWKFGQNIKVFVNGSNLTKVRYHMKAGRHARDLYPSGLYLGNSKGPDFHFAELKFFKRRLNDSEIKALFNNYSHYYLIRVRGDFSSLSNICRSRRLEQAHISHRDNVLHSLGSWALKKAGCSMTCIEIPLFGSKCQYLNAWKERGETRVRVEECDEKGIFYMALCEGLVRSARNSN